jgi:hypothetical protein
MPRAPFTLSVAAIAAFFQGCSLSSSSQQSAQVQDTGGGIYKIGVGRSVMQGHTELDAAVAKAGEFCHAKGLKLVQTRAVENNIIFRCGGAVNPQ